MPGVGKLEPFDVGTTSLDEYQERVEQFFIANDVEDEKKASSTSHLFWTGPVFITAEPAVTVEAVRNKPVNDP
ncbi:hypothetical protein MTO96_022795 [Rhipicephalus appendiculatus]